MKIEMCSATIISSLLPHVVILFLSFSLTGIALLSSATVHSEEEEEEAEGEEKKKEEEEEDEELLFDYLRQQQ